MQYRHLSAVHTASALVSGLSSTCWEFRCKLCSHLTCAGYCAAVPCSMYYTAQPYRTLLVLGSTVLLVPTVRQTLFWFTLVQFPPRHYTTQVTKLRSPATASSPQGIEPSSTCCIASTDPPEMGCCVLLSSTIPSNLQHSSLSYYDVEFNMASMA